MHRALRALAAPIPERAKGWIDFARPSQRPVDRPLNGQPGRVAIVEELATWFKPSLFAETGTNRGDTTFHFSTFGVPVHTVELHTRTFGYAQARFRRHDDVHVEHGDSRPFLRRLAARFPDARPLIYLDAHWYDDLPLAEELAIIAAGWQEWVVLIDDFEVPEDPGYGYYDYPPGIGLSIRYLADAGVDPANVFFPSLPSAEEQGAQRGCSVVVPAALRDDVAGLSLLRPTPTGS